MVEFEESRTDNLLLGTTSIQTVLACLQRNGLRYMESGYAGTRPVHYDDNYQFQMGGTKRGRYKTIPCLNIPGWNMQNRVVYICGTQNRCTADSKAFALYEDGVKNVVNFMDHQCDEDDTHQEEYWNVQPDAGSSYSSIGRTSLWTDGA